MESHLPKVVTEALKTKLECELLARARFVTDAEARQALFTFLEGWYNPHRLHSALGYCSPMVYEQRQAEAQRNVIVSELPTAGRRRGRQRRPAARPWTTRATLPTGANLSMTNSTANCPSKRGTPKQRLS
ncbi:IS3 family transposase [Cupriavidus necator]|uniref:IS3 family transposase n=1 Tax=Cupriavidus necator TaxID=106590 RepID=UPI0009B8660F